MAKKSRKNLSGGGLVRGRGGPRSDSVPAWVSPNEFVLPADTTAAMGLPRLNAMVAATHRPARLADGGLPDMNSYGNDMSLANRMNAAAEQMRKDRVGPGPSTPTTPGTPGTGQPTFTLQIGNPSPASPPPNANTIQGLAAMDKANPSPNANPLQGLAAQGQTANAPNPSSPVSLSAGLPPTNGYGNDMTLTNRMNAGAEAMRVARMGPGSSASTTDRQWGMPSSEGTPLTPYFQDANHVGSLGGHFADGGVVNPAWYDAINAQNNALQNAVSGIPSAAKPFQNFSNTYNQYGGGLLGAGAATRNDLANSAGFLEANIKPILNTAGGLVLSAGRGASEFAGGLAGQRPPADHATTIPAGSAAAPPPTTLTPSAAALTHAPTGSPGDVGAPPQQDQPINQGRPAAYPIGDVVSPEVLFARQAGRQGYAPMADAPPWMMARNTALQPGTPAYSQAMLPRMQNQLPDGATLTAAGGSEPLYQRQYLTPQGSASGVTSKPPGPGGFTVMDQGNGGTVEGNVAALDRQTEALRSLREARNPGITGGGGLPATGAQPQTFDPFSRPGDAWGDSEKRQNEYQGLLRDAASARPKRAAAMMASAQGLLAPGLAQMERQGQFAQGQGQQQAGLYKALLGAQNDRAGRAFDAQKWGQQYGIAQQKAQADQQKAQFEMAKSGMDLFMKAPAAQKTQMANQLWGALNAAKDAGDQVKAKDLEERWNLLNRFDPNFMNQLMQGQGQ